MVKKHFFLLFIFISIFVFQNKAQNRFDSLQFCFKFKIDKHSVIANMDKLGNIYCCDGNILYKYDENGILVHNYSSLSTGNIYSIDTYNPLKIIVFAKDFQRITFLNNKLAPQQDFQQFDNFNIFFPACVCASYDNGFWVYDENINQLFRFDANGQLSNQSPLLNNISESKINLQYIQETENNLLLGSDSTFGWYVFNHFGNYIKSIPYKGILLWTTYEQNIIFVENDILTILDITSLQSKQITLPEKNIIQVKIQKNKILLLDSYGVVYLYNIL